MIKMKYTTKLLILLDRLEETLRDIDEEVFEFKKEVEKNVKLIRKQIIEFEFNQIKEKET